MKVCLDYCRYISQGIHSVHVYTTYLILYGFSFLRCLSSRVSSYIKYFLHLLVSKEDYLIFLIFFDQFYSTDQRARNFHLSVILTFKIFEFVLENLELVDLYLLRLDLILPVQDVVN